MSPSFVFRSLALALALSTGLVAFAPAPHANAHQDLDLPFDFRFPQEIDETTFSNTWGARRSGGRRHRGTDLMAEKMTEVYAFADGVVAKIGDSRRAGRYIVIEHDEVWDSYYIHLNNDNPGTDDGEAEWSLTVATGIEVGSHVVAGQLIGWVGDSGNAERSGAHTHFELRKGGRNLNPYHVLKQAHLIEIWKQSEIEAQSAGGFEIV